MQDEFRVWISSRKLKSGKRSYSLRWVDHTEGKWRSTRVGTDRKRAEREAAMLEDKLRQGTFADVRHISWADFVEDDVSKIRGRENRKNTSIALRLLAELCQPASPRRVTFGMLESFVIRLATRALKPSSINLYLRCVRAALNRALRRGYIAKNPFDTSLFLPEEERQPRTIGPEEEAAILAAARKLYGFLMEAFIHVLLNTGARKSEALKLSWEHVTLEGDGPNLRFIDTKGHKDRVVPIHRETQDILLRLKAQTLQHAGPFARMGCISDKWRRVKIEAEVDSAIKLHDCRRTYVSRLIAANVPLPTVQKLAGHQDIATTVKFYNAVSMGDRREAVEKLRRTPAAG